MSQAFAPVACAADLAAAAAVAPRVVLSFDVEEHHRIEAAAGLCLGAEQQAHYRQRLEVSTRWVLEALAERGVRATFFVVGEIARFNPDLVRALARAGHEVASHGWDHRRVHHFNRDTFRDDVCRSKDALEQVTGTAVRGYRAPTFSVTRDTAWALDVLAEAGIDYDSSIYPVRHDRYGVPGAPRGPFLARGERHEILELPPATLRLLWHNLPVGGGGYFRLFPPFVLQWGLAQLGRACAPAVAMLYFHPWEFDAEQQRLPLGRLGRLRTYVGIGRTRERLKALLVRHAFTRAADVVTHLAQQRQKLPRFDLVPGAPRDRLPARPALLPSPSPSD
jgi:polysaccharide deacetylase family protein (PEP-CTERM system associated)